MLLNAWYSKKAAPIVGVVIYSDAEENEVRATEVVQEMDYVPLWDDAIFMGVVNKYVRREEPVKHEDFYAPFELFYPNSPLYTDYTSNY